MPEVYGPGEILCAAGEPLVDIEEDEAEEPDELLDDEMEDDEEAEG